MALNVIIAYRGDTLGLDANQAVHADNADDLAKLNQRIQQGNGIFKAWAEGKGGRCLAQMGDGGRLEVGADHLEDLPQIVEQYQQEVDSTVSVGVGKLLSEAEKALELSVLKGGDSIELFTEELEAELAERKDPDNPENLFNSYLFDKAEPALNKPAAGGGMTGPSMSTPSAPAAPVAEGSEHSENEALQGMLEDQPPAAQAPDLAGQFDQLAQQSEASEAQAKDQQAQQQQQDEQGENLRSAIVEVLKQFKEQAPLWEQLKEAQPDAYKTLTNIVQAMIGLARVAYGGDEGQQEGEEVQKNEVVERKSKSKSAAFRHPITGEVIDTGAIHDIASLPDHNIEEWEDGFVDEDGKFHTRTEAMGLDGKLQKGSETLEKRSKNVRQHLASVTPEQVLPRVANYLTKLGRGGIMVGAPSGRYSDPEIRVRGGQLRLEDQSSKGLPVSHEAGHAFMTPEDRNMELHQENIGSPAIPVEPEDFTEEYGANAIAAGIARRAGVRPKQADPSGSRMAQEIKKDPIYDQEQREAAVEGQEFGRKRLQQLDAGIIGLNRGKLTRLSDIHAKINARAMTKAALEPGKTGRHQVILPPGSQLDSSASASRNVGKIKILDPESQKTKWRSVRAGLVMDPKGLPTSSRHPQGDT